MTELDKFNQMIEESKKEQETLQKQIQEQQTKIASLKINYQDYIINNDDAKADKTQKDIEKESRLLQRQKDKLELISNNGLSADIKAQADKAVTDSISHISEVRGKQQDVLNEYRLKRAELSELDKEFTRLGNIAKQNHVAATKIGKEYPDWSLTNEHYRDGNLLPDRQPSISFRHSGGLSSESIYQIEQKYRRK